MRWQRAAMPGSSPHAWGIHIPCPDLEAYPRFIPTCVGNTRQCCFGSGQTPVHPHMRGEYGDSFFYAGTDDGSSPHAWGIRQQVSSRGALLRFIPTCVGNTIIKRTKNNGYSVHPHMRGEYAVAAGTHQLGLGSSPHAWGIRHTSVHNIPPSGFIPTCVGNTLCHARR